MSDDASATRDRGGEPTTVDRRTVLKGLGAAAVTGVGTAGVVGSASARSSGVMVIDFDETDDGEFAAGGKLPVVDELFVYVHGWFGNTSNEYQTAAVVDSVRAAGYSPDAVVSINWPASNPWYTDAESDTEGVGAAMVALIENFEESGGGNVRLTGHSLGGRVVYWTATKTDSGNAIDTIGAMGTAAYGETVCPDGMWYEGIAGTSAPVRNYHSGEDRVVGTAYGFGGTPLGNDGAPCDGASNYEDVDVTSSVSNHLGYIGDEQVGRDLAAIIKDS
jgi:pimeloyl-ACP methyl ester carboxylesterase